MDWTVLHSPVARKGQMTIPEKVRKGLRVKLGDKLQYEVEEYRATVPVHPGIRSACTSTRSGNVKNNRREKSLRRAFSPESAYRISDLRILALSAKPRPQGCAAENMQKLSDENAWRDAKIRLFLRPNRFHRGTTTHLNRFLGTN